MWIFGGILVSMRAAITPPAPLLLSFQPPVENGLGRVPVRDRAPAERLRSRSVSSASASWAWTFPACRAGTSVVTRDDQSPAIERALIDLTPAR